VWPRLVGYRSLVFIPASLPSVPPPPPPTSFPYLLPKFFCRYGPVDGNIYVANLRGAKATDRYTLRGDPAGEVYEPRFTYHGFRYVSALGRVHRTPWSMT